MNSRDVSLMLECLSDRVLRNLPPSVWRQLFLRPAEGGVRFQPMDGTLLCAHAQQPAAAQAEAELQLLAALHGGELDPCPQPFVLVHFDEASAALDMALALQQMPGRTRFQVGLVTGQYVGAHFEVDGRPLRLLVGAEVERAAAVTQMAPAGSVRVAADTLPQVKHRVAELSTWLVTTEWSEEDLVCAVSLALPPAATEQLSTFAGLGLT